MRRGSGVDVQSTPTISFSLNINTYPRGTYRLNKIPGSVNFFKPGLATPPLPPCGNNIPQKAISKKNILQKRKYFNNILIDIYRHM